MPKRKISFRGCDFGQSAFDIFLSSVGHRIPPEWGCTATAAMKTGDKKMTDNTTKTAAFRALKACIGLTAEELAPLLGISVGLAILGGEG